MDAFAVAVALLAAPGRSWAGGAEAVQYGAAVSFIGVSLCGSLRQSSKQLLVEKMDPESDFLKKHLCPKPEGCL